jgi:AcrR family transcriptional regulator
MLRRMGLPAADSSSGRAQNRRRELVEAAYALIAERGLEGLRFGDVARQVGVNNGTLVHYFDTKEGLIQAVVGFLIEQFASAMPPAPANADARTLVRMEFEDARARLHEHPDIGRVYTELLVRAQRDPAIAAQLKRMDEAWQASLVRLLEDGRAAKLFRKDLDAQRISAAIMAMIKGAGVQSIISGENAPELDTLVSDLAELVDGWTRRTRRTTHA